MTIKASNKVDIGVIGAGSWGCSLANLLAKKGHDVTLWAYEKDLVERMNITKENDLYLPGIILYKDLKYTNNIKKVAEKSFILVVPPSQLLRDIVYKIRDSIREDAIIISASKGIENNTLMPMSDVLTEILPNNKKDNFAFISGPTFAREVAQEIPSAVVAASTNLEVCEKIQQVFSTDYFRVYTNSDVIGVELGGALKNVIAIAAGVCDGLGYGHNSRAALITRGLAEIKKIGIAMGARAETFSGLAGMGDLVLTCTGDLSRNRSVGIELGKGRKLAEILKEMSMVAEGVKTTLSTYELVKKLEVEAPIIEQMYLILYKNKSPREAVKDLMLRDLKREH